MLRGLAQNHFVTHSRIIACSRESETLLQGHNVTEFVLKKVSRSLHESAASVTMNSSLCVVRDEMEAGKMRTKLSRQLRRMYHIGSFRKINSFCPHKRMHFANAIEYC